VGVSAYQDTVTAMLSAFGWHGNHTRPVYGWSSKIAAERTMPDFFTPTTAVGWPDLTYVHPPTGVVLACEVKQDRPKNGHRLGAADRKSQCACCPTPEQADWLWRWHQVPCCAAVIFRPGDDALQVSRWLAEPETLVSGYGWLVHEKRRHPITRHQLDVLPELLAAVSVTPAR
jgi:hypothetical protein